jgi:hypothetical protein
MDLTQVAVVSLVALVMGWFAFGVIRNLRRGNAVLQWMQSGLPSLGARTTLRWLGSSAVTLGIAKARPPFRQVELLLVLEPRDVPWLWLLSRARGRRDLLIVRGQLARPPRLEWDVLAPGSWSERERRVSAQARGWEAEPLGSARLLAPAATRSLARAAAPAALAAAQAVAPTVWRLSSRREAPQLELHVPLPDPRRAQAQPFFAALRALAEHLGSAAESASPN